MSCFLMEKKVTSTHRCLLDLPQLPTRARIGLVIPGLASHSLVSVVTLCNAGCEVTFTKIGVTVRYNGKIVLRGNKCTRTGLWMVPIIPTMYPTSTHSPTSQQTPTAATTAEHQATNMVHTLETSSKEELAKFHHQTIGSPQYPHSYAS